MTTIYLRPVDGEGRLGEAIAQASDDGEEITYQGLPVLKRQVEAVAFRFRVDEREAFDRLARDGWSNGKLSISAEG